MNQKILRTAVFTAAAAVMTVPGAVYGLLAMPRKEKKKHPELKTIVCIGDSITFGAGVLSVRGKHAWPYILNRLCKDEYEVLNYGISGAAMSGSADTPYKEDFYKAAEELDPQKILVMLGTNDSKPQNWNAEEFEKDYESFLNRFAKEGREIILLCPPKAFAKKGKEFSVYNIRNREIQEGAIPIIQKLSDKYCLRVIDLYALTEDHPEYFKDGVHPNVLGNQMIANHIYRVLTEKCE